MINFDDYTNKNKTKHNPKWSYIYRKTNALLNFINNQPDIDKYEGKYQYLINKHEKVGLKYYDDSKGFIEYSMMCKMFIKILENII